MQPLPIPHLIGVEQLCEMLDKALGYSEERDKMNSIDPSREIGNAWCFKEEMKYSMWSSWNYRQHNNGAAASVCTNTHTWTRILSGHWILCMLRVCYRWVEGKWLNGLRNQTVTGLVMGICYVRGELKHRDCDIWKMNWEVSQCFKLKKSNTSG